MAVQGRPPRPVLNRRFFYVPRHRSAPEAEAVAATTWQPPDFSLWFFMLQRSADLELIL